METPQLLIPASPTSVQCNWHSVAIQPQIHRPAEFAYRAWLNQIHDGELLAWGGENKERHAHKNRLANWLETENYWYFLEDLQLWRVSQSSSEQAVEICLSNTCKPSACAVCRVSTQPHIITGQVWMNDGRHFSNKDHIPHITHCFLL